MNEQNDSQWQTWLEQAARLLAAGDFDAAEALYRKILESQPQQWDAMHNLGCLLLGRYSEAVKCDILEVEEGLQLLLKALQAQPECPQYWLSYIEALLLAGRPDEARQCLLLGREAGLSGAPIDRLEIHVTAAWLKQPDLVSVRKLLERAEHQEAQQLVAQQVQQFGEQPILLLLAGEVAIRMQDFPEAIRNLKQASVSLQTDPAVWHMLGLAQQSLGDFEAAYCSYLKGLRHCPNNKQILADIGRCLFHAGRLMEAMVWLRLPLLMGTDDWSIWDDFIQLLCEAGIANEAMGAYQKHRQALRPPQGLQTRSVLTMLEMGLLETAFQATQERQVYFTPIPETVKKSVDQYVREKKYDQLGVMAQGLCEQYPFDAFGWKVLGVMVRALGGDMEQALLALQLSAAAAPEDIESQLNLAVLMTEVKRPKAAELACRRAIAINPGSARPYFILGISLQQQGKSVAAVEAYEKCLELNPKMHAARSAIQFSQHYSQHSSPESILKQAREFGKTVQAPVREIFRTWHVERSPAKLKIGFVSGDLRKHPVGFFTEGFLKALSRISPELYVYHNIEHEDELTARIKPHIKKWKSVEKLEDRDLAKLIHKDGIHVLIDLSGHTAHNRLPVFTRRPAPVQASWLGYFATTGIAQIDYFIGDVHSMIEGEDAWFVEKLWRLPETYCCMERVDTGLENGEDMPVSVTPAVRNGYVTFGCFNKLSKMSDPVFETWVSILKSVPESRLLLNAAELIDEVNKVKVRERFVSAGIDSERIMLYGWNRSREEHMKLYGNIDIALDPFPYVGVTTSFESLWMGVPVLTCRGERFLSNMCVSIVRNAGLPDWVADDREDYVVKAIRFARDVDYLASLRAGMRDRLKISPLFNVDRFASNFETMLWQMWDKRKSRKL